VEVREKKFRTGSKSLQEKSGHGGGENFKLVGIFNLTQRVSDGKDEDVRSEEIKKPAGRELPAGLFDS
jgi:hypothetical protein